MTRIRSFASTQISMPNRNSRSSLFSKKNLDVFTCQISDMSGIPKELIEHELEIDPAFKSIKQ
jgi:hypothetical protein